VSRSLADDDVRLYAAASTIAIPPLASVIIGDRPPRRWPSSARRRRRCSRTDERATPFWNGAGCSALSSSYRVCVLVLHARTDRLWWWTCTHALAAIFVCVCFTHSYWTASRWYRAGGRDDAGVWERKSDTIAGRFTRRQWRQQRQQRRAGRAATTTGTVVPLTYRTLRRRPRPALDRTWVRACGVCVYVRMCVCARVSARRSYLILRCDIMRSKAT